MLLAALISKPQKHEFVEWLKSHEYLLYSRFGS